MGGTDSVEEDDTSEPTDTTNPVVQFAKDDDTQGLQEFVDAHMRKGEALHHSNAAVLISLKPFMNDGDGQMRTPLHWTATNGNAAATQVLIHCKAAIDPVSKDGNTPLLLASALGFPAVLKALLDGKADPNMAKPGMPTALEVAQARQADCSETAKRQEYDEVIKLLSEDGVTDMVRVQTNAIKASAVMNMSVVQKDNSEEMLDAVRDWDHQDPKVPNEIRELLNDNADINYADENGRTALHWLLANTGPKKTQSSKAQRQVLYEMYKVLIQEQKENIDLEARTEDGQTAMHLACSFGLSDATAILLAFNADPSAELPDGRTAQQLADRRGYRECSSAIEMHEADTAEDGIERRKIEAEKKELEDEVTKVLEMRRKFNADRQKYEEESAALADTADENEALKGLKVDSPGEAPRGTCCVAGV